jgi:hypothetical protein
MGFLLPSLELGGSIVTLAPASSTQRAALHAGYPSRSNGPVFCKRKIAFFSAKPLPQIPFPSGHPDPDSIAATDK